MQIAFGRVHRKTIGINLRKTAHGIVGWVERMPPKT